MFGNHKAKPTHTGDKTSFEKTVSGLPGYIDKINLWLSLQIAVALNKTATQRRLQNTKATTISKIIIIAAATLENERDFPLCHQTQLTASE